MLKKTFKKTHDGKVTAHSTADGIGLFKSTYLAVCVRERKKTHTLCAGNTHHIVLEMHFSFSHFTSHCFRILQGLTSHSTDTYETIKMDKKPIV